jgi:uncharacterized protein YegL
MPKLMNDSSNDEVIQIPGGGNFQFSAERIENLVDATEYTLVTIVCDISGSVISYSDKLLDCIKSIVKACKKSPRAENLLVRLLTFNENITEIHGFKSLNDIDPEQYSPLQCTGFTALYDATYDGVGATLEYAKRLTKQDYGCNGAVYIITDGADNRSTMTPFSIKEKIELALREEHIESIISILVALRDPNINGQRWANDVKQYLDKFYKDAGLTQFVDIGDATSQKLAKLANFVSQSISSQSQALGTGAPSQTLQF